MAKYNTKREKVVKKTTTHQGGSGYTQTPEMELVGILATGMTNNFYETEGDREKRFKDVIAKVAKKNKTFAAKALVYARTIMGQRSVTHFGAVEMIPFLQGDSLGKRFFSKRERNQNKGGIVYRLDDMMEILAAYFAKNGSDASIPNAIKRGFKEAIEHADAYQLAKYQQKNRNISLVDIVNLVHPKQTDKNGYVWVPFEKFEKAIKGTKFENKLGDYPVNSNNEVNIPALKALILGLLKQFNTVEDKNTDAGKKVSDAVKTGELTKEEAKEKLTELKTDNYAELIKTRKIGYLALLRNLRNILKTKDANLIKEAGELLKVKEFIKKSLVWPHQIDLAIEILKLESEPYSPGLIRDLSIAYENAIPNLSELMPPARTAVVYDTSGSMDGGWGEGIKIDSRTRINAKPVEKAALIAATLAKGIGADIYQFATKTAKISGVNLYDSVNTITNKLKSKIGDVGHGTYYESILPELGKRGGYERIFIITDEQGADYFERSYKQYSQEFGTPYVYFINIVGYAPVMLKTGSKVFRIHGYGPDIYELVPKMEIDPKAVIAEINKIEI